MLDLERVPNLEDATLVIGFRGWMDGGEVSTGTIEYLIDTFDAELFGEIHPDGYYIYGVPGALQIAALFRPHATIEEGRVTDYQEPTNEFYVSESANMVMFIGDEPHLHWHQFAEQVFRVIEQCDVTRICFVGSVTGLVPHTREPIFYSSFSNENLRPLVTAAGIHPTQYEGPSSFGTFLIRGAEKRGMNMSTLVAGIPPYVQGRNEHCIESLVDKLQILVEKAIDTDELAARRAEFDRGLDEIVNARPELRDQIKKLEDIYDQQVISFSEDADSDDEDSRSRPTNLEDLQSWFDKQGFRFDN